MYDINLRQMRSRFLFELFEDQFYFCKKCRYFAKVQGLTVQGGKAEKMLYKVNQ